MDFSSVANFGLFLPVMDTRLNQTRSQLSDTWWGENGLQVPGESQEIIQQPPPTTQQKSISPLPILQPSELNASAIPIQSSEGIKL